MFQKLPAEKLKKHTTLKSNLLTKLKNQAIKEMPLIEGIIDEIFPKKTPVIVYSIEQHLKLYAVDNKPVMVELGTGDVFPMLRTAIDYPGLLPVIYVDEGAVNALLRGADLMAPGIKLVPKEFEAGAIVQVNLLDCDHPFMIGQAQMSSAEAKNAKGIAVKNLTILRDALYMAHNGL
ncbi:PUA domain containing protein [Trichomonas vaginalis G3]|uniref:PUA domain containing protein n=1 Tax=Trichomonas vaginalis (strain ATCC PRA-98 / G3) TaxID=412133 RepID=A2EJQ9_TRIV3|nr:formation of translation preinitiation complex [Trichomonas vaginalis G3]EAY07133.1 PUA domain containing protein [Trichomonas vaginalis G3]KAI5522488.1 formation of translation preinitiation complex [Trichomonas vaginalis G3]|eukprot:XP_001319356.1 PUA domain containing protein [Trichomonas vaginalis G3]